MSPRASRCAEGGPNLGRRNDLAHGGVSSAGDPVIRSPRRDAAKIASITARRARRARPGSPATTASSLTTWPEHGDADQLRDHGATPELAIGADRSEGQRREHLRDEELGSIAAARSLDTAERTRLKMTSRVRS